MNIINILLVISLQIVKIFRFDISFYEYYNKNLQKRQSEFADLLINIHGLLNIITKSMMFI